MTTARHCGLKAFAFSLITNKCETDYDIPDTTTHEEVVNIGVMNKAKITNFVTRMVKEINKSN